MSKEYIKDNGKVRKCASNLVKMNILEWVYYYFKDWNGLDEIKYHLITDVQKLCIHMIDLLVVVFFPIIVIIKAILSIRSAKKEYINWKKEQKNE